MSTHPSKSVTSSSSTVQFNVGGKIYEVSRSLLEHHPNTMLARMASDTWRPGSGSSGGSEQNDGSALFIERDGDEFKYVLKFMRDGGTDALPPTVSKGTLLQELTYYGFEDVDPTQITVEALIPMLKTLFDHVEAIAAEFDSLSKDCDLKRKVYNLAKHCLDEYKKDGSLEISVGSRKNSELNHSVWSLQKYEELKNKFNEILESVGWEVKKMSLRRSDASVYILYIRYLKVTKRDSSRQRKLHFNPLAFRGAQHTCPSSN